jgi:hypothetical protein
MEVLEWYEKIGIDRKGIEHTESDNKYLYDSYDTLIDFQQINVNYVAWNHVVQNVGNSFILDDRHLLEATLL